jgi:acyl-CoA synthetase (AMP-forming)/AMP-acid ligase II
VVVGGATGADVGYEQLIAESPDDPLDEVIGLDEVCMLPHTSGTTGTPKGVMLTHGNITWNIINLLSVVDFSSDDVTVAIAPFFRTGGTGVNVLPVLFTGGTVIVPEAPDPDEILRLIEQQRVTIGFGNPDLLDALTRSPRWPTADFSSVRCYITGGAPVPERLIRAYMQRGVTFPPRLRVVRGRALGVAPRPTKRPAQGRIGRQAAAVRRHPNGSARRHRLCLERDGRTSRQWPQRDGGLLGSRRRHPRSDR